MKKNNSIPDSIEAQAYLAAIIDSSDDAIIGKDLNGNIISWNQAAERIFGYFAEETIGKHISFIIPPDRLDEENYILGQVRNGKRIDHFQTIRRAKDGRLINLSVTVSPIKNQQGKIIGASKIARDTTGLKESERTSAYLGSIIESSDDAIISKDLNGFVTSWNKSAERIFGYLAHEVLGKHITLIIPNERLKEEEKILTTLKTGNRVDHFETVRRHKDGHLIPVSLTVSPIRDSSGNIIGASKISRDISERINAEKALMEFNHKKDEFMANMSHELRTPMNAVIGLANLLTMSNSLSAKDRKFVETLKTSADNLMDLINDLLDFSKIESGSIQLETIEFNLTEQVEKVVSIMNVRAKEKDLALHVYYPPALNRFYMGDPLRIQQILMNLVSNAIKFTDKGLVEIHIDGTFNKNSDTTMITIKVKDTGMGIPKDKQEAIFEKFMQADASISRRFGGSGLGLAITKGLVERMGGKIMLESDLGIGSTFIITLELKNTKRTSSLESFSANAAIIKPVIAKNILLVEDYEPNILVATSILEEFGYNYDIAENGTEALRKFAHNKYDIILMDVQMHELDGMEATRRIRQIESEKNLPRTPIIAMTAHVREQDKNKCLEVGMDDYIPKPFNPNDLSKKIAHYISAKKESDGSNAGLKIKGC